jgi:hypothetical protein
MEKKLVKTGVVWLVISRVNYEDCTNIHYVVQSKKLALNLAQKVREKTSSNKWISILQNIEGYCLWESGNYTVSIEKYDIQCLSPSVNLQQILKWLELKYPRHRIPGNFIHRTMDITDDLSLAEVNHVFNEGIEGGYLIIHGDSGDGRVFSVSKKGQRLVNDLKEKKE